MRWMIGICLLGLVWLPAAQATAVRAVSLQEALRHSELVFQGRVMARRVIDDAGPHPFTRIVFAVEEVIKGDYAAPTLTLDFAGAPERGLVVADMDYPEPGEAGIYFVESLRRRQANPLYGWSQGHFRIVVRGGRPLVVTADGRPVVALTPAAADGRYLSRGVAKCVRVRRQAWDQGLAPEDFKAVLRNWLEGKER